MQVAYIKKEGIMYSLATNGWPNGFHTLFTLKWSSIVSQSVIPPSTALQSASDDCPDFTMAGSLAAGLADAGFNMWDEVKDLMPERWVNFVNSVYDKVSLLHFVVGLYSARIFLKENGYPATGNLT